MKEVEYIVSTQQANKYDHFFSRIAEYFGELLQELVQISYDSEDTSKQLVDGGNLIIGYPHTAFHEVAFLEWFLKSSNPNVFFAVQNMARSFSPLNSFPIHFPNKSYLEGLRTGKVEQILNQMIVFLVSGIRSGFNDKLKKRKNIESLTSLGEQLKKGANVVIWPSGSSPNGQIKRGFLRIIKDIDKDEMNSKNIIIMQMAFEPSNFIKSLRTGKFQGLYIRFSSLQITNPEDIFLRVIQEQVQEIEKLCNIINIDDRLEGFEKERLISQQLKYKEILESQLLVEQ